MRKKTKRSRSPSAKKIKKTSSKIDQRLLDLPHSSLRRISKSLEKIVSFSSDLAEKSGIAGVLGRAVLLRAKVIRMSLRTQKKTVKKPLLKKKMKTSRKLKKNNVK